MCKKRVVPSEDSDDKQLLEEVRKRIDADNGCRYSLEDLMNEAKITLESLAEVCEDILFE